MIFIDADAFIAARVTKDSNYLKAEKTFQKLSQQKIKLVTSWDVIDEVATKLSRFTTHQIAVKFLTDTASSSMKITYPNHSLAEKAMTIFAKQTSKRVSLTDCTNMAIMSELGITTIFSFDHHYSQNGFKLFQ